MPAFAIAAFYRFLPMSGLPALRDAALAICVAHDLRGTLLLAPEGVNGTLAGPPDALAAALEALRGLLGCPDLRPRLSKHGTQPFRRLKVRLKREIVSLGVPNTEPARRTGTRVPPAAWNRLLADPDIPVIDVRNAFEHAIGSFAGALDPGTAAFSDFPAFVHAALDPRRHKAVALFCTGGIRCEKAGAFMLDKGFETVFQLDGGALAYLAEVAAPDSRWRGGCFVFDERVAVGLGLAPRTVRVCRDCSWPLPTNDGDGAPDLCGRCAGEP